MSASFSTSWAEISFWLSTPAFTTIFCFSRMKSRKVLATPGEFLPPTMTAVGPTSTRSKSGRPRAWPATWSELFLTT